MGPLRSFLEPPKRSLRRCKCCIAWVDHLKAARFSVALAHHVAAAEVKRLLAARKQAVRLAAQEFPLGGQA